MRKGICPPLTHGVPLIPTWDGVLCMCTDLPYINALHEQVKADCDSFHNKVRRARDADFPKILHTDLHHHGGKLSYALVREPSRPPVDQVLHPETCHAQMLRHKGKNGTFRLKVPCGFQCSPGQHIECNSNPGVITCVERQCITVMGTAPSTPHVKCQVKHWITDPQKAGGKITAYWNQFWQRDTIEESISLDEWSQCVQNVDQHISQHETIYSNGRDLQLWRAAIKATKNNTAVGGCGFSQPELADLSDRILSDVITILEDIQPLQWPEHLVTAKVVLLNKLDVFSLLCRTWAKVHSSKVFKSWSKILPDSIVGGLPKRKTEDVWLRLQAEIEDSILNNRPIAGFVMDTQKAFNGLPRQPVAYLMKRLGINTPFGYPPFRCAKE